MHTHSSTTINAIYSERLQQAVRVMEGLSESERTNFCMRVFAVRRESGISACIAGFCGLDPWFQDRGFTTTVGGAGYDCLGHLNLSIAEFFGTEGPFFACHYGPEFAGRDISVDDAIAALWKAIASFDCNSMSTGAPAAS